MLHEPAAQSGPDPASEYKQRLGVVMFIIYAIIYGGFTFINVVNAKLMEMTIVFGLNLAVVYGFTLIIVALIMAMIYNHMCTKREKLLKAKGGQQ
jgi:uncharacterized membrane protein (DUF485 family)